MKRQRYSIPLKTIFVRGNILVDNKLSKPLFDIGCYYEENGFVTIDKVIESDFTINDETETSENEFYYASGEVYAYDIGGELKSRYHIIQHYDNAIDEIVTLSEMGIDEIHRRLLNKMLFANIYASMEAFLQDICSYYVMKEQEYKEKFLKSHTKLSQEKFHLFEVFDKIKQIDYKIINAIENTVFHRIIDEVEPLFNKTFGITFPNYKFISDNLPIRHDIVHRNGHSNKGEIHLISKEQLDNLIKEVDLFVHSIFDEFEKIN